MGAVGIRRIEFKPPNNLISPPTLIHTFVSSSLSPPPPPPLSPKALGAPRWRHNRRWSTTIASPSPSPSPSPSTSASTSTSPSTAVSLAAQTRLAPFGGTRKKIPPIAAAAAYKASKDPEGRGGGGGMVGPSRPIIVLFGSSVVQYSFSRGGWGATLADVYARKADIVLRGYIGWNSRRAVEVLDKVFPKDAPVQPSLVIVYFGGNDSMGPHPSGLGPHVPLPEYVENMRKIATHLQSLSEKTRIIFLSCPPVNEEMLKRLQSKALAELVRTNEICHTYSEACIKLCKELDVKVVDLWTAMQEQDDWQNVCFTDGVHLTSEGSNVVVKEVLKVIKEAEWQPSLYWKSLPTEFSEDSPYDLVAADGVSTLNPSDWTFHREIQWD